MKRILLVIVVLCLTLSSCKREVTVEDVESVVCTENVTYNILDPETGGIIKTYNIENIQTQFRVEPVDVYRWVNKYYVNPEEIAAQLVEFNRDVDNLNAGFHSLFSSSFDHPSKGGWIADHSCNGGSAKGDGTLDVPNCWGDTENSLSLWDLLDSDGSDTYYDTTERVIGDTVYVKSTTPGGSEVKYSFPKQWLYDIWRNAFVEGTAFSISPQYVTNLAEVNQQDLFSEVLKSAFGQAEEIGNFKLNTDDFEGRSELESVLAKAIEVGAAQAEGPVFVFIIAFDVHGQQTISIVEAHQDTIHINGSWNVFHGDISGDGGELSLHGESFSTIASFLQGSIFIIEQ
jgi:hypothetical protein